MSHDVLKAGDTLAEHLRLFAEAGSDDTGTVWEAVHAFEGRVAVKVFLSYDVSSLRSDMIENGVTTDGRPYVVCPADVKEELIESPDVVDEVSYDHLHDALTCRPPMKRNWFPVFAAAAVAAIGALAGFGVF